MTEKYNDATYNRPEGERVLDNMFVEADLNQYARQIKDEHAWQKNDRNAITIFKTIDLTLVLTALHKGAKMMKENAVGVLIIQALEGRIQFHTENRSAQLSAGQMMMIHKGQTYDIEAIEESIFLLSLYNSNQ